MGSGHFPLDRSFTNTKELIAIATKLNEIAAHYADLCSSQDQPDNAFSDGEYVAWLTLAAQLVDYCVRMEK